MGAGREERPLGALDVFLNFAVTAGDTFPQGQTHFG